MIDLLQKYLFKDHTVRVQAVRLQQTWRQAQQYQQYPAAVQYLLGELVAASALLAANIKFDGSLLLQIQGDGPIALVVVECQADLGLRASVKLRPGVKMPANRDIQSLLNPGGNGRFRVVLDLQHKLPGQQVYQGIVPLEGNTIAQALEHYMKASEQLDTRLWLRADERHAAGLLVQRLPVEGGTAGIAPCAQVSDTWTRATHLAATISNDELLSINTDTLIRRLYGQETLLAFPPLPVRWQCTCTRERIAAMLRMLGPDEISTIIAEQGEVSVTCEFCGKPYQFDKTACASLFISNQAGTQRTPPIVH
jgi:molecular chaperone Hsp33